MRSVLAILISLAAMIGAWVYASAALFGGAKGFKIQARITRQYLELDRAFPFAPQDTALSAERVDSFIRAQTAFLPGLQKAVADFSAKLAGAESSGTEPGAAPEGPDLSDLFAQAMMDCLPTHAEALRVAEMSLAEYRWIEQQIHGTLRLAADKGEGGLASLAEAMRAAPETLLLPAGGPFRYTYEAIQSRLTPVKEKQFEKDVGILSARLGPLQSVAPCVVFDSFLESLYVPKSLAASLVRENAPKRPMPAVKEGEPSADEDM